MSKLLLFTMILKKLAKISENLGEAMVGIEIDTIPQEQQMAKRGW